VNIFVFLFATFLAKTETGLDAGQDGKNLDRGEYRFKPIEFVNSVVPSPCETAI